MKRHSPLPATPVYDGVAVAPLHLVYRSPDISYDKTPGRKQGIQCFRFLGSSALSIARLAAVIAASLLSDVPDFVPVSVSTDHFQRPRWIPWIIRYSTPRCSMLSLPLRRAWSILLRWVRLCWRPSVWTFDKFE